MRYRGAELEAYHRGAGVIVDASETVRFSAGDSSEAVLPRSALKLVQALPFVESGAAAACSDREIALAAASHTGEESHIEALAGWARRLGIGPDDLVCGPDLPLGRIGGRAVARGGEFTVFHNNNAGKHLAVLATCRALGEPIAGYGAPEHPAQRRLLASLRAFCGLGAMVPAFETDNCGMPTFALPLRSIALGMARLARHQPAAPLLEAITREPTFFAGSRRIGTAIIEATRGRVIAKGGSEGIFAALDRERGWGFALKVRDGSGEAATRALVELMAASGSLSAAEAEAIRPRADFWAHPFAPERSPRLAFPFLAQFDPSSIRQS